jgi:uncharacterized protein (TIGR02466 family)
MISNSKIEELFVTPVLTFDIDADVDKVCQEMEQHISWKDKLLAHELEGSEIQKMYDEIQVEIEKFSARYNLPGQVTLGTVWRIWHDYGERETAHFHLGGFFSSIVYLKTPPGGGDLLVLDPRGPICWNMFSTEDYNKTNPGASDCRVYQRIVPRPGRVVILPSWLVHYSEQNFSKESRVLVVSDWTLTGWETVKRDQDAKTDVNNL